MPCGPPSLRASSSHPFPRGRCAWKKDPGPRPAATDQFPGRPTQAQPSVPQPRACFHLKEDSGGSHACSPNPGALPEPRPRARRPRRFEPEKMTQKLLF